MNDTPDLFFWPGEAALATQLATWLNAPPPQAYSGQTTRRGLILWRGPDHHLTACLTLGQGVQHALTDWKIAARSLLAHARQNRRTLILVEADTLRRGGAAPLAQRLGHAAPPDLPPNPTAPVAQALARLALLHDADLQTLLDDLTAASLPGPDIALGDLLDLVAADSASAALLHAQLTDAATATAVQLADLTATLIATTATRDSALVQTDLLQSQLHLLHENAARQTEADQTRAAAATLQTTTLQALIATQDQGLAALTATLAARSEEADLLRAQLFLGDSTLTRRLTDSDTLAGVTALRVQALENQLALQGHDNAQHLTQITALQSTVTDLTARLATATAAAKTEIAHLTQSLSDRGAELDLLRAQLELAHDGTARTLTAARNGSDAATLRLQTLDASTQQSVLAAETRLAAQDRAVADRAAQVAVLTTQIALLDATLTRALMAPAPEPDATPATTDPDYWDKALARALAAARTEADQRARLEQELATLKAATHSQTRRAADQAHSHKLFAQMTKEATASLDEIARLAAALAQATAPTAAPDQP